ncbi:hypothetical protein RND71_009347 [Anisodus tanguticus]|uniref:Uncharacterized protein n=1 Tax=Anisodus tanguticus TaxID=243964 RepID=A0AAE1SI42_9SOLA|nr:hypothetical protein RND71_009347 [Anisodus tanguticus]
MMNNTYSPIRENTQEEFLHEEPSIYCLCFKFRCFQSTQKENEANSLLQENKDSSTWMVKKLKDLKEYSELVAGPKWKNLVRKIGKYCNNPKKKTQLQYDSDSYALNFDDDVVENDDGLLRNFSSRFAAPFIVSVANPNRNAGLS